MCVARTAGGFTVRAMTTRFASETAISQLTMAPLMTVSDRMRVGRYGPTFRRGRGLYASIAAVQSVEGIVFSDAQITAAAEGRPDRIISIPDHEEDPHHGSHSGQACA
jgi:hypothetical protein